MKANINISDENPGERKYLNWSPRTQPRGSESANDGVLETRNEHMRRVDAEAERDRYKALAGELADQISRTLVYGFAGIRRERLRDALKSAKEAGL